MEKPRGWIEYTDVVELGVHTLFEFDQAVVPSPEKALVILEVKRDTNRSKTTRTGTFQVTMGERLVAEIIGFVRKNKRDGHVECRAFSSTNSTRNFEGKSKAPRVVGRTIAELVSRGIVERWYSDYIKSPHLSRGLTNSGRRMYEEYLSTDPRLDVQAPCLRTMFRYLVTAKPQVSTQTPLTR